MTTRDGSTWSEPLIGEEGEHLNAIVWAKDRFVAIGAGVTFVSQDGEKWERHVNRNAPTAVVYGGGLFVGCRWKGRLLTSTDGIQWEETLQAEQHVEAISWG